MDTPHNVHFGIIVCVFDLASPKSCERKWNFNSYAVSVSASTACPYSRLVINNTLNVSVTFSIVKLKTCNTLENLYLKFVEDRITFHM